MNLLRHEQQLAIVSRARGTKGAGGQVGKGQSHGLMDSILVCTRLESSLFKWFCFAKYHRWSVASLIREGQ